jgi:hypothetical protein
MRLGVMKIVNENNEHKVNLSDCFLYNFLHASLFIY